MSTTTTVARTVALLAFALAGPAAAADLGAPDAGHPAPDQIDAPGLTLGVGGLAVVRPKYEGSKDYEVMGVPYVAPSGGGSGFVQFKGVDDLRFRLLDYYGFEAGPVVGYRFGRDQDDAARLQGLGDVDGGLVAGGFVAWRLGAVTPFVTYNHQVTGDETGGQLRAGVEAKREIGRVTATFTAGATWADDDYMSSYFGVTAAQSVASGLAQFDAEAGIKDVYLGASADVPLGERWTLKLMGRYAHLLGDAADSPIVETESQWMGGVGLAYRFTIPR